MENKNFIRFMGFQKQSFTLGATQAHDSGDAAAQTVTLTATDGSGDDFGDIVTPGTAGTDIIVVVTADGAETGNRGTKYEKDANTGVDFTAAANVAAGDVTRLHSSDVALHASNGTVTITGKSGANGYNLEAGETVDVYTYLGAGDADTKVIPFVSATTAAVASTAFAQNHGITVAAKNYLGANPIADGVTTLQFKSHTGGAADDEITLYHKANGYLDVCKAMEMALNAGSVGRSTNLVFTDFVNDVVLGNDPFELGITECHINCA